MLHTMIVRPLYYNSKYHILIYQNNILGLFYILAVGVTDEYIQLFSGRTSGVKDVVIDFIGGLFGIALVLSVYLIYKFIKFQKNKHLEELK